MVDRWREVGGTGSSVGSRMVGGSGGVTVVTRFYTHVVICAACLGCSIIGIWRKINRVKYGGRQVWRLSLLSHVVGRLRLRAIAVIVVPLFAEFHVN